MNLDKFHIFSFANENFFNRLLFWIIEIIVNQTNQSIARVACMTLNAINSFLHHNNNSQNILADNDHCSKKWSWPWNTRASLLISPIEAETKLLMEVDTEQIDGSLLINIEQHGSNAKRTEMAFNYWRDRETQGDDTSFCYPGQWTGSVLHAAIRGILKTNNDWSVSQG